MRRVTRAVAVGYPYHVTHRGNHRKAVFFEGEGGFVATGRLLGDSLFPYGLERLIGRILRPKSEAPSPSRNTKVTVPETDMKEGNDGFGKNVCGRRNR